MKNKLCGLLVALLGAGGTGHAQTIIVSADTNILSGLDPSLTTFSVSDLALRPSGIEQFLVNTLQGGTTVFVDPSTDGNRGVQGANEQTNNYYNGLSGISSVMPGGDFTDLTGFDLLVSIMPETPYTAAELSAMEALLNAGGTIFFLGDSNNFSLENAHINDALSFLGSDMRLDPVVTVTSWPRYTTSVATHPLMGGVPNFSVAVAGSVSGGPPLAFFNSYVMVAVGSGVAGPVDSDGDGVPDDQDVCEGFDDNVDTDGDSVPDGCDSCPLDAQNDADGDGVCGDVDICPGADDNADMDLDGSPDACDVCPIDFFNDADDDGFCADVDNCPTVFNSSQSDNDTDGIGDECDSDDDNDGYTDEQDNCPLVANDQADFDGDGAGDACDADIDGDQVTDNLDQCLLTPVGDPADEDGCAISQLCPCDNNWKNHGAYVRCVAQASEDFVANGLISEAEKDSIVSAAGQSSCGAKK